MNIHERFTEGDCHVLAMRLHRVTGWPLASFVWGRNPCLHAFVIHPDGDIVDVDGKTPMKEFKERWGDDEIRTWTIEEFKASCWRWRPVFGHYSYAAARRVAGKLLDDLGWT